MAYQNVALADIDGPKDLEGPFDEMAVLMWIDASVEDTPSGTMTQVPRTGALATWLQNVAEAVPTLCITCAALDQRSICRCGGAPVPFHGPGYFPLDQLKPHKFGSVFARVPREPEGSVDICPALFSRLKDIEDGESVRIVGSTCLLSCFCICDVTTTSVTHSFLPRPIHIPCRSLPKCLRCR